MRVTVKQKCFEFVLEARESNLLLNYQFIELVILNTIFIAILVR